MNTHPIISFKRLSIDTISLIYQWAQLPHVAQWWEGTESWQSFEQKYRTALHSPARGCFIIYMQESPIGYIQWYSANRFDEWKHMPDDTYGIDFFIGEVAFIGKGYGTKIIRQFIDFVFKTTNATTIIADPDCTNNRAIQCLLKVGFKKIMEIEKNSKKYILMEIKR